MKRILHVVPSVPFGGLQRVAVWLVAEQRRVGSDAHMLCLYSGDSLRDMSGTTGIPSVFAEGCRPSARGLGVVTSALRLPWDIIHVHSGLLWSNVLVLLLKRCPVVFHAHNYPPQQDGSFRVLNMMNRLMFDQIIAVSDDVALAWQRWMPEVPVTRVYNGLPLPKTMPATLRPDRIQNVTFGMATRLAADKGLKEFVEVAEAIHQRLPEARFIIAGSGPEEESLRQDIEARGLSSVFSLPGHIQNIEQFWNEVDIALFTAPGEAFGLRIVEPMRQGVPVVAYSTGAGSDEVLRANQTALVAEYGKAVELAELAVSLAKDEKRQRSLTSKAFTDLSERFSVACMCDGVTEVYKSIFKTNA